MKLAEKIDAWLLGLNRASFAKMETIPDNIHWFVERTDRALYEQVQRLTPDLIAATRPILSVAHINDRLHAQLRDQLDRDLC